MARSRVVAEGGPSLPPITPEPRMPTRISADPLDELHLHVVQAAAMHREL
jgi:hypothetical protein